MIRGMMIGYACLTMEEQKTELRKFVLISITGLFMIVAVPLIIYEKNQKTGFLPGRICIQP